jgi:hypothetical protein
MGEAPAVPIEAKQSLIVRFGFVIIAAIYLLLNVLTADRSPTVGMDEAIFTEPAINLIHGHGFTVEHWNGKSDRFWTGNAPLYSLLLSVWLRAAPFSPTGVRTLNYLITLSAAAALIAAARRFRLVDRGAGMMLLASLLCAYSISFSYRSGRYDMTLFLVVSLAFFSASIPHSRLRLTAIFLACTFVPWAGFQLPAYAFAVSIAVLLALRRKSVMMLVALWSGIGCGAVALLLFYSWQGVLPDFIATIGRHSIVPIAGVEHTGYNSLWAKWTLISRSLLVDPLSLVAAGLLLVATVAAYRNLPGRIRSLTIAALAMSVMIPIAFAVLYSYPMYYAWMVVIPLATALAAVRSFSSSRAAQGAAIIALLWLIVTGLPLRLILTALEWRCRDYAPVRALVLRNVRPADRVYGDFPAYYPVKEIAAGVAFPLQVYPPYRLQLTQPEKAGIDVLILGEETFRDRAAFPGHWQKVDALSACPPSILRRVRPGFGARPYELEVWRRVL